VGSTQGGCEPNSVTVTFGEDTISGCTVSLTQVALSNAVCDVVQTLTLALLQGPDSDRRTHVGIYGDASYLNISDWIPIMDSQIVRLSIHYK
jgi:hypothetical protein